MTSDMRHVRVLIAALYVASAAATQPRLDLPPSLRKKKLEAATDVLTNSKPFLQGAIGGAAYGLAAAAISHPFDTIKTRLQTKAAVGGGSVLSRMLGLYSGVGPAAASSILFRAVPFVGYEATRSLLRSHRLLVTDRDSSLGATDTQSLTPRSCLVLCQESQPLLAALLGGMVGGVMRGCVETPAELLKTRLQVGAGLGSASLLLRGLRSTCLRNAAAIGLFWLAYEAKSCIQSGVAGTSTSVWHHLAEIYRAHGVRGWYAGLSAGLLRAFLANGGGMALYSIVLAKLALTPG